MGVVDLSQFKEKQEDPPVAFPIRFATADGRKIVGDADRYVLFEIGQCSPSGVEEVVSAANWAGIMAKRYGSAQMIEAVCKAVFEHSHSGDEDMGRHVRETIKKVVSEVMDEAVQEAIDG